MQTETFREATLIHQEKQFALEHAEYVQEQRLTEATEYPALYTNRAARRAGNAVQRRQVRARITAARALERAQVAIDAAKDRVFSRALSVYDRHVHQDWLTPSTVAQRRAARSAV